jgi:hypothetical protein
MFVLLLSSFAVDAFAQSSLQARIAAIAAEAHSIVSVSCKLRRRGIRHRFQTK